MRPRRIGQIALIALTLVTVPAGSQPRAAAVEAADKRLHQRIGQMIMVGFDGTDRNAPGFRRIIDDLEQGSIGGVLFLARNIASRTEVKAMVDEIRRCRCAYPPLIAIDEEGGVVQRLGKQFGYADTPSAARVAATGEARARLEYEKLARKLGEAGFNMNLAPVVDLNKNRSNPVIGSLERSFSDRPDIVSRYASILIEEHHKRGVLTALKHFPGHGSSTLDSHRGAVDVEASWSADELVPYRKLRQKGMVDAVLVGHLANARRWGGVATQAGSHAIDRLLRRQIGFAGVTLSDDLIMEAVNSGKAPLSNVVTSAIRAGVDMVIVSRLNEDQGNADPGAYVHQAILAAVKSGEIQPSSIRLSAKRIERLKLRLRTRKM